MNKDDLKPKENLDCDKSIDSTTDFNVSASKLSNRIPFETLPVADNQMPKVHTEKFLHIPAIDRLKSAKHKLKSKQETIQTLPICRHCVVDGVFKYEGEDPLYRKGIWKRGKVKVCAKRHSLQEQNNKGVWYVCDEENMHKCHYYEPKSKKR
ncbi:hypothetical protein KY320_01685 [Candidatus Woesearchaeota archaeon]|nr:hypothetical protein [Candidatus Woesearchaeota archaeon]